MAFAARIVMLQTTEEKRKKKIGIAGVITWGILLGVVIGRAYFKGPVREMTQKTSKT